MNSGSYKRLGDYIRQVDVRNKDLAVTQLVGVSINKSFMPSVANVVNTDLSNYKVIKRDQFACNLMHVDRDEIVPIAIYGGNVAIVSPAYPVFEVKNHMTILPKYLMLCFMRKDFDRRASYYSGVGIRGGLTWEDFCDIQLPLPSIERQQEIVDRYEMLSHRISLNKRIISKLEETAQTIYRKHFVDGIDLKSLPEGWKVGTIKDFCNEIVSGGTPSRAKTEYWDKKDYRWLKTGEVQNNVVVGTEEYISREGLNNSSARIVPEGTVVMAMYGGGTVSNVAYLDCETTTNQACCNMICRSFEDTAYLYFHLRYNQEGIKRLANGGAQENLSQDLISNLPIMILTNQEKKHIFSQILRCVILLYREQKLILKLQSILLSTMTNI